MPNKVKYVSADIYEYFAESATYEDAEEVLNNLYLQPKNEIFARHQLAIRKQKASESLEQYIQELRRLSKNIDFKDVTANTYREEMIRDSVANLTKRCEGCLLASGGHFEHFLKSM